MLAVPVVSTDELGELPPLDWQPMLPAAPATASPIHSNLSKSCFIAITSNRFVNVPTMNSGRSLPQERAGPLFKSRANRERAAPAARSPRKAGGTRSHRGRAHDRVHPNPGT
jgi:hypothetical protein